MRSVYALKAYAAARLSERIGTRRFVFPDSVASESGLRIVPVLGAFRCYAACIVKASAIKFLHLATGIASITLLGWLAVLDRESFMM